MNHYNLTHLDDYSIALDRDRVVRRYDGRVELTKSGETVVSIATQPAELVDAHPALRHATFLSEATVAVSASSSELGLTLYCALQQSRVDGRTSIVTTPDVSPRVAELLQPIELATPNLLGARVDVAMCRLAMQFEGTIEIPTTLYLHEVTATVNTHVRRAFNNPASFFGAVAGGHLSKPQFIYLSSQQHFYVRYTTRLLGYCVAHSEAADMRRHFARHLAEEVNHEKIIEADLRYLGADVDYVVNDLEANVSTAHFLHGALALVTHYHDPVLLMSVPLIAEGMSAHLDRSFVESLNEIVRSWGYDEPSRATNFISSHIDFDSGDDGHFEQSVAALEPHLTNERSLRRFISALHAQADSFLRIYLDGMTEAAIYA